MYGRIEVEVRLLRQGHGADSSGEPGSGFAVEQSRVVRIELHEAKWIGRGCPPEAEDEAEKGNAALVKVEHAIRDVIDADALDEMQERWRSATTGRIDPDRMRRALEVLEGA